MALIYKKIILLILSIICMSSQAQPLVGGSGDGGNGKPRVPFVEEYNRVDPDTTGIPPINEGGLGGTLQPFFPLMRMERELIEKLNLPDLKLNNIIDVFLHLSVLDSIDRSKNIMIGQGSSCKKIKRTEALEKLMNQEVRTIIIHMIENPLFDDYLMQVRNLSQIQTTQMIEYFKEISNIDYEYEEKP